MSVPVLTFFNNKGGVGKTSLIYHLAWMFASLGKRVVVADLDPQANLTAGLLSEVQMETLWEQQQLGSTIFQCVAPLTKMGDLVAPTLQHITTDLYLIPGDIRLSEFEEVLSTEWPRSMGDSTLSRPMRILSSFWQVLQMGAAEVDADIILVDLGPNLGAINRSVLIATDYVVIPLGADLFSIQGLRNLGPTLRNWKKSWQKRLDNWSDSNEVGPHEQFKLPEGVMKVIGYVCQQHGVRFNRPHEKWINRIPREYRMAVLEEENPPTNMSQANDPYCLATIKHYRSLVSMGQEFRKPIFNLTSADGAIGSHANAVRDARVDFQQLANKIADTMGCF